MTNDFDKGTVLEYYRLDQLEEVSQAILQSPKDTNLRGSFISVEPEQETICTLRTSAKQDLSVFLEDLLSSLAVSH